MKILAISCSPRKNKNTVSLLNEALKGAVEEGVEVELYSVAGKNIQPCDGCRACNKTGKCGIKDDMQELFDKILAADGIIFGTPVYFYNVTAQCKAIIDRTISLRQPGRNMNHKVGGIVVVGASFGNVSAVKDLGFYFVSQKMLYAGFISAYATDGHEVHELPKCLEGTRKLGKGMAKLVKMDFKYPEELLVHSFSYGTHTK